MGKGNLFVQITDSEIKLLVGNRKQLTFAETINAGEYSFFENKILNTRAVAIKIKDTIAANNLDVGNISFAIDGQDVIIRHIETPFMKNKELEAAVKWEISQQLPNNGENHYVDFQIEEKLNTNTKKMYKVMVVAAPKEKIDSYVELADKLKLGLGSIDIASNCLARVFKTGVFKNEALDSIGIIDMGKNSSSIVVLDKGNLFFDREVPYGINNMIRSLAQYNEVSFEEIEKDFPNNFNFMNSEEKNEIRTRIQDSFDNVLTSFEKIIQFYTTGKNKKSLDRIYLMGQGAKVDSLDVYINNYFNTPSLVINTPKDININIKNEDRFDFKLYINVFGLLLRKSNKLKEINLLPDSVRAQRNKIYKYRQYGAIGVIVFAVLFLGVLYPQYRNAYLQNKEAVLKERTDSLKPIIVQNEKNTKEISDLKAYIAKTEALTNTKVSYTDNLMAIGKLQPGSVTLTSFSFSKGVIAIAGTSGDMNAISEFAANLRTSKDYSDATIKSITKSGDAESYSFSITINGVGGTK